MSQSPNSTEFDPLGRFILEDFDHSRPFSSFLPGIAGLHGIPMWAFYVNRGQGICSFGVEDKDHPILEFQSANKAYQSTPSRGFRTFLNGMREGEKWSREAFSPWAAHDVQRKMFVGMNEFEVQEVNWRLGVQINVLYFLLPNLPFSGLVRRVMFRNLGDETLNLEVLDGLPGIVPYGLNNDFLKNMGRTIEAWICVENLDEDLPFFRLKATPGNTTAVEAIQGGNYALSFSENNFHPAIVDPKVIFGMDTSYSAAHEFTEQGLKAVIDANQIVEGHTMCAFFGALLQLEPDEAQTFISLFGTLKSLSMIREARQRMLNTQFIDKQLNEARAIAADLTDKVDTVSGSRKFNGYCRQTFLDNLIRGGYPIRLGERHIYHVYSRKHGDIERDYNYFVLPPTYYSQGNGNYRDINQNRRNDVFFIPQAGEFNIRLFMSLIQADGYNPLVINGVSFSLPSDQFSELLAYASQPKGLAQVLKRPFSPGELFDAAVNANLSLSAEDFLHLVISQSDAVVQAEHGEGFWIDHWTYNLDLIDAYLAIFPDRREDLLFYSKPLPFYDNPHIVQPRKNRYVLHHHQPRQRNAVVEDPEKAALIDSREVGGQWARTVHGKGEIFCLSLISKLALLALIKFATRDPWGMGIQMEAGKPGWYDALNGLPGLFGSSMPEAYELLRLVNFLRDAFVDFSHELLLPVEAQILLDAVETVPDFAAGSLDYWEHLTSALERYRESIRLGFDGRTIVIGPKALFTVMVQHLEAGFSRLQLFNEKIPPTYFKYQVTDFTVQETNDPEGNPHIAVKGFAPEPLPPFLEGIVRLMKVASRQKVRELISAVRDSGLFDEKLKMVKVNASLKDESHEIGRAHAFTPGWLENESIWMHMSFKYLLVLLRKNMFEAYFDAFRNHLPPFMDPKVYGRSPLENSSFLVSSAHPDTALHGNGFVARLSGSTAEFLSMWLLMTVGKAPFQIRDGELTLKFEPALASWLFKEDGTFTFRFLGFCDVTLLNPQRLDTYREGFEIEKILLYGKDGLIELNQPMIPSPYAAQIRSGEIDRIECFYPLSG